MHKESPSWQRTTWPKIFVVSRLRDLDGNQCSKMFCTGNDEINLRTAKCQAKVFRIIRDDVEKKYWVEGQLINIR